ARRYETRTVDVPAFAGRTQSHLDAHARTTAGAARGGFSCRRRGAPSRFRRPAGHAESERLPGGTAVSDGLSGVHVLVVGAGLAGLCAARDLLAHGAQVTVVDARPRLGGRVWTIRE